MYISPFLGVVGSAVFLASILASFAKSCVICNWLRPKISIDTGSGETPETETQDPAQSKAQAAAASTLRPRLQRRKITCICKIEPGQSTPLQKCEYCLKKETSLQARIVKKLKSLVGKK